MDIGTSILQPGLRRIALLDGGGGNHHFHLNTRRYDAAKTKTNVDV